MKESNKMRKTTSLLVIGLMISSYLLGLFPIILERVAAYTPHDTIHINGNADFTVQVASEGWSGNGTEENPYLIEGYDILPNLYGIEIKSTTVNFIIRDSRIKNGAEANHCGIYLKNVTNGVIENCIIENNLNGLILSSSNHNIIVGNEVLSNNHCGLLLSNSNKNIISKNEVSSNDLDGIYIIESCWNDITDNNISNNNRGIRISLSGGENIANNTIIGNNITLDSSTGTNITSNSFTKSGIIIGGDNLEHWNTHNIDTSNTINGRPIYYWKNQTGGMVPADQGQVILANCSDVKIENQELNNCPVGIVLGFSTNNSITGNTISSNGKYGIYLYSSWGNKIISNNINDSGWNIHLYYSNDNLIKGNTIINTLFSLKYMGIHLQYSDGNNITDNKASINWHGIYLHESNENNITNNNASNNEDGIYLNARCKWNNFIGNTVSQNTDCGIYIFTWDNNTFHHNIIINNTNQVYQSKKNTWDDGNGEGNYWSNYNGSDEDGDGVGDTNLPHQGVDYYPLMPVGIADEEDEAAVDDRGPIFSELWFLGLIIPLVIVVTIILAMLMHKKRPTG